MAQLKRSRHEHSTAMIRCAVKLLALLALSASVSSNAFGGASNPSTSNPTESLVGVWLVEAADVVRVLRLEKVLKGAGLPAALHATYSGTSADVTVIQEAGKSHLQLITPAGTRMALLAESHERLVGRFEAKTATGELIATRFEPKQEPIIEKECGFGRSAWEGKWTTGNFGVTTLVVENISDDCVASIRYGRIKTTAKLINSSFEFMCNQSTGGICKFRPENGHLSSSYRNSQGGSNSAVFRRVL